MNVDAAIESLWHAALTGTYPPAGLEGEMSLEEAYCIQLAVLDRRLAAGVRLAGWKVGLSSDATRKMFGLDAPVSAYLLADRRFASGSTFACADFHTPIIESELCIVMGRTLRGPGVTGGRALAAIAGAAPALELVDMRLNIAQNLPLGVADGVAQWGFVTGPEVRPYPADVDLAALVAETRRNGETVARVVGGEAIDDQIETIAWLANHLAEFDRSLEAGQCVTTGSMTKPTPIQAGDVWETTFSTFGRVSATFT